MFKTSLLTASLGGPTEQHTKTGSKDSRTSKLAHGSNAKTTSSTHIGQQGPATAAQPHAGYNSFQPSSWALQAANITDSLPDAGKYKSVAVYAEVKLAEALDKAQAASPCVLDADGEPLPSSLTTAVCCQLLGEVAEMCGPLSKTLLRLRDELVAAIYSNYAAAQTSGPLQFDQMPWFSVAVQLRKDNAMLLEQQETFKLELSHHQEHMVAVEQQLLAFKAAMDAGEAAAAALQSTNAALVAAEKAAVEEAAAAAGESHRLANNITRLQDELHEVQEQLSNVKETAAQDQEQWERQLAAFKKRLYTEEQEREAAVAMAAARLSPAEAQELEQRCAKAERELEEAQAEVAVMKAGSSTPQPQPTPLVTEEELRQLTPRPTDWGPAQALAGKCQNTADTVQLLLQQHADTTAALEQQIQLLQSLQSPDPTPKFWGLSIRAESSKYFITEGAYGFDPADPGQGLDSSLDHKPKVFAEPLGLGADVPKFLRWNEQVQLHEESVQQLEQQVQQIWAGKAVHEAVHGLCPLQSYLHCHFSMAVAGAKHGNVEHANNTTAAAANPISSESVAAGTRAAAAGYQFYHSLCSHRLDSVSLDIMWQVLTGQLPETVLQNQQHEVEGLVLLLQAVQTAASPAVGCTGGVLQPDLATALRFMYPLKPLEQLTELTVSLMTVCAAASTDTSTDSSVNSSSTCNQVSISSMAAVVTAISHAAAAVIGSVDTQQGPAGTQDGTAALGSTATATAAAQEPAKHLVNCLLRQHLQAVQEHTEQVVQQVQELLLPLVQQQTHVSQQKQQQSTTSAWQQLEAFLVQQLAGGSGGQADATCWPTSCSGKEQATAAAAGAGSSHSNSSSYQGGSRRTSRYSSSGSTDKAAAIMQDMPLLAAAAAAARPDKAGFSTNVTSSKQAATRRCSANITCSAAQQQLQRWLATARVATAQQQHVSAQQLVHWLRREVLFPPFLQDVEAARQWCRTAFSTRQAEAKLVEAG